MKDPKDPNASSTPGASSYCGKKPEKYSCCCQSANTDCDCDEVECCCSGNEETCSCCEGGPCICGESCSCGEPEGGRGFVSQELHRIIAEAENLLRKGRDAMVEGSIPEWEEALARKVHCLRGRVKGARNEVDACIERTKRRVAENPFSSLAIALAAGLFIGSIFRRR